jgi:hypothetical protein
VDPSQVSGDVESLLLSLPFQGVPWGVGDWT